MKKQVLKFWDDSTSRFLSSPPRCCLSQSLLACPLQTIKSYQTTTWTYFILINALRLRCCLPIIKSYETTTWTYIIVMNALRLRCCLPMPKHGISLAIASRNFGWEMANTIGLRQEEVFAANNNNSVDPYFRKMLNFPWMKKNLLMIKARAKNATKLAASRKKYDTE